MTLYLSTSKEAFSHNVKTEADSMIADKGDKRPKKAKIKQAVAIAYAKKREAKKKR